MEANQQQTSPSIRVVLSDTEREMIRSLYPTTANAKIASLLGICVKRVIKEAQSMGLAKDPDYLRSIQVARGMKTGGGRIQREHTLHKTMTEAQRQEARRLQAEVLGTFIKRGEAIRRDLVVNYETSSGEHQEVLTFFKLTV